MILFYLKKNFCDGWDNLLWIALCNLVILALGIAFYFGMGAALELGPLSLLFLVIAIPIMMIPSFAASNCCARLADFKSVTIKNFFLEFPKVWKIAILFGLFITAVVLLGFVALPFYLKLNNLIGIFLAALIFWTLLVTSLSLQWFMPVYSQLGGNFGKILKKCFILFFDNPGFSLFMGIYSILLVPLSFLLAFLAPGAIGIILAHNNALRLRLYKYDWLETQTDVDIKVARKQIPWDELLAEDKETVGPRSFKSFIFPWK
jgi:hypothetical protein